MHLLPFIADYPEIERIPITPDVFCERAKDDYPVYQQSGFYHHLTQAALYIYQVKNHSSDTTHTGVVGMCNASDYASGAIKAHEKTILAREKQQLTLMQSWGAVLKPVLLAHQPSVRIEHWLNTYTTRHAPDVSAFFESENHTHSIWQIATPAEMQDLEALFSREIATAYIADGHHRATAMAKLQEENPNAIPKGIFSAFFAADQLYIGDFNRVIDLPSDLPTDFIPTLLSRMFDITPLDIPQKPQQKHDLTLFYQGQWLSLRWKPEILQSAAEKDAVLLDTALLNTFVLGNLPGITDIRTDKRIQYIQGNKGLEGLKKVCHSDHHLGFVLYPIPFSDLQQLTDKGGIMPPKSTFFEPRLKSGLLVCSIFTVHQRHEDWH